MVALQNGIGLVPRQPDAAFSIIQIRDGAVTINGQELTGRELRERLGADADLVLRASYLDATQQQQLVAAEPGPSPPPAVAAPDQPGATGPRRTRRQGEIVRVGGDVRVERDERIEDDVVAVFGSAQVDGEVDGDVAVVGGSLTLGPEAVVHGDVNVIGGTLNRAATARIEGEVHNVGVGGGPWRFGAFGDVMRRGVRLARRRTRRDAAARRAAHVARRSSSWRSDPASSSASPIARRLTRCGPASSDSLPSCCSSRCVVITVVVLAVSIIGIPLLVLVPFGIVLALVVLLVGFTGVAYQVGRMLHGRFGWSERGVYATVTLGVLVIGGLTILARSAALLGGDLFGIPLAALGYCVEFAAWTIGFGAAILVWLRSRRPELHVPALP